MWRPVNDVGQAKHLSSFPPHTLCFPIQSISLSWGRIPRGGQIWMTHIRLVGGGGGEKGIGKNVPPRTPLFIFFLKKAGQALETGDICSTKQISSFRCNFEKNPRLVYVVPRPPLGALATRYLEKGKGKSHT